MFVLQHGKGGSHSTLARYENKLSHIRAFDTHDLLGWQGARLGSAWSLLILHKRLLFIISLDCLGITRLKPPPGWCPSISAAITCGDCESTAGLEPKTNSLQTQVKELELQPSENQTWNLQRVKGQELPLQVEKMDALNLPVYKGGNFQRTWKLWPPNLGTCPLLFKSFGVLPLLSWPALFSE